MEPLQPDDPQTLGNYRLLGQLGVGGMGRVYLARSPGGRTVAVKVVRQDLAADQAFRQRFRHEVDIARAVSGRYTAPVVDADPDAPLPWLATAYVLGPDLTDVVAAHGALPEHTVRALGAGLAAALQEIHAAGLIHRDLKPSNVLLAADGPRVIDFGIARAVDGSRLTQTGVVVGSPGYMPPEQALGRPVDGSGDVFSLGAVLAFAATGRNVFGDSAAPAALLYQVVHEAPDLTGTPQMLTGLIRACLAKDPAQRPSPAEILQSLAPDGTGAVLADWLPSSVSSTIATHASRILDLETPASGNTPVTVPAPAAPVSQGFGPAPTTLNTPGATAVPVPVPATPSRRRFLGIAGGAAGVAVVGGGAAWLITRDNGTSTSASDAKSKKKRTRPVPEVFTTPPNGVAPRPLWHEKAAGLTRNYGEAPQAFGDIFVVVGSTTAGHDVKSGKQRWARKDLASATDKVTVSGNTLYLPGQQFDGAIVGYDIRTGKESWRTRLGGKMSSDVHVAAVDGNRIYAIADLVDGEADKQLNNIVAVDIRTRKLLWSEQRDAGTEEYVELNVGGGCIAYTHGSLDDSKYNLTVRDAKGGHQLWNRKIADDEVKPTVFGGLIYLGGPNELRAVDLKTGHDRWALPAKGRRGFRRPSVLGGVLYVMDYDGGVWAADPKTGEKHWMEDLGDRPFGDQMVRAGDSLYIGSVFDGGGIYALNARTGKYRWDYNDGVKDNAEWELTQAGNRLLVAHADELYALPAV
ncbi:MULTISPECIES: serine/threonine-protein kinase [unclassified Streptomyces]|uniref:serine/threonine-protein kinase n=1 Tax=unclassified Streptomyces TaxID=2593676 RepID=UPI002DDAAE6F|nr:PQQ-binding-like beta-propeller repeat protein [Streptomyces sp. NBC_01766]WSC20615.1 PQQ-binding-like beta-propeller repeat protein [Streptomyces sp. NBC_01766]